MASKYPTPDRKVNPLTAAPKPGKNAGSSPMPKADKVCNPMTDCPEIKMQPGVAPGPRIAVTKAPQ